MNQRRRIALFANSGTPVPTATPPTIVATGLQRITIIRGTEFERDLLSLMDNTDDWEFQWSFTGNWATNILDAANNRFYLSATDSATQRLGGDTNTLSIGYRATGSSDAYTTLGTVRFFISVQGP